MAVFWAVIPHQAIPLTRDTQYYCVQLTLSEYMTQRRLSLRG